MQKNKPKLLDCIYIGGKICIEGLLQMPAAGRYTSQSRLHFVDTSGDVCSNLRASVVDFV